MRICGQWFSSEVMHDIRTAVVQDPTISRSALARKVCERLDWKRLGNSRNPARAKP